MSRLALYVVVVSLIALFVILGTIVNDDKDDVAVTFRNLGLWNHTEEVSVDSEAQDERICVLPFRDPWTPAIVNKLKMDRTRKICPRRPTTTVLRPGGFLVTLTESASCHYRLVHPLANRRIEAEEWVPLHQSAEIKNDFVETKCSDPSGKVVYRNLHYQVPSLSMPTSTIIQVVKEKGFVKEANNTFSIFLLVLDSISSHAGARALLETQQVFRYNYEAVTFRFHNKVGLNSRPNAHAMFAGNRLAALEANAFRAKAPSEFPNSCAERLRRNETIHFDAIDANYALLMAEDWVYAFDYPDCNPFEKVPTKHYSEPIFYRPNSTKYSKRDQELLKTALFNGGCERAYHKLLEYTTQFLDTYNGTAKFAYMWHTMLAHDNPNPIFKADADIADFLRANQGNLENSFVFVMGDHGNRFGSIRQTEDGEYEDNNPMLMVALPRSLRGHEQLVANLNANARKHTSQFDMYATLFDIMHVAKKNSFTTFDYLDFRKVIGDRRGRRAASLLRPIGRDRNCIEMEIPDEFCLCHTAWTRLAADDRLAHEAGVGLVAHINAFLDNFPESAGKCQKLKLSKVSRAQKKVTKAGATVLRLTVKALPSEGVYEALLRLHSNSSLEVTSRVKRVNAYDNQGNCAMHELSRPLCFCKVQEGGKSPVGKR
ncbi:hypothetical protein QR680_005350 [Steinernema hermaphroditum]|uniref:Uncharacterized protein n=1 Tax=Steinernema hermaphroditum TaxID=289476 RepID=A0AA39LUN8_9BILA|nr:hypothetical protein QR680_005350 [Steinernema hermaphroditum]